MKRFTIAFFLGALTPFVVAAVIAERGLWPLNATAVPTGFEAALLTRVVHTEIARRAAGAGLSNPLPVTDDTLLAGMKVYRNGCAGCHGEAGRPSHWGTHNFYPRVPQFADTPPQLTVPEMFLVVKHGIRFSGMAGWDRLVPDDDIWRVVTFLSGLRSLPPAVSAEWTAK